ncbi:substrate-binding domain-containing protein [Thermoleptolyngbya sichuanensis XZ-Cy5]|uniref:substrate-binding domain-containing protein n=1 Tax=Thermoleptolyngbya sichuanensis TaxID=2885951 RepID=UPI00240E8D53|nr:helix-hairpin-helix domain-containing protein [Thermoleptolyngbya sichuanensis]MDG2615161.1 substrate-binding domain-containing protein [Thermoleptolyngbya sichuanensis XZ-Cy5]
MSKNFGFWTDRFASAGLAASGLLLVLLGIMPANAADLQTVASKPATLIRIDGARDLLSLNRALKQQLEAESPDLTVEVQSNGTDAGLAALKRGEVDLVAVGRSLTPDELAQGFKTLWLDQAQIAVIVSEDNPFKGHLTVQQFEQILRGDITNWTQVGGPDRPIRLIDRPPTSETRAALQQYGLVPPDALPETVNRVLLKTDDTAEVIAKLGKDGIGYAIASQLTQQTKARVVKLAVPQEVLPMDARYPLEQVGAIAYRPGSPAAAVAQNLTTSLDGQALLSEAKRAIALEAGKRKTVAIAPGEVVPGGRSIGSLLKWVLLPLLVLGGLLTLVQAVLARQARQRNQALSAAEQAVSLGRSPDSTPTRPAATAAKTRTNSAQVRIPNDTAWTSVSDAVVIEGSDVELEPESTEEQSDDTGVPQTDDQSESIDSKFGTVELLGSESNLEPESELFLESNTDTKATDIDTVDAEAIDAEAIDAEVIHEMEDKPEPESEAITETNVELPAENTLPAGGDRPLLVAEPERMEGRENESNTPVDEPTGEFTAEDVQTALVTGLAFSQALTGEPKQTPSLIETLRSEKQTLELEIETLRSRLQDADTRRSELEAALETAHAEQSDRTADLDELRQTLAGVIQEKDSYWQALSGFYAAFVGESLNPGERVDFAQLRPQIEHRQADLAALHDQLETSQREREAIAADLEAASAELRQVNAERNELTNQIVLLQRELEAQRNSETAAEEETQSLQALLQAAQAEKTDLDVQLDNLRLQFERIQAERNDVEGELISLRSRLTELEGLETELRTEVETARSQAENAEAAVSETENALLALRLELDAEKATRSELDVEVTLLRASVAESTRVRAEEEAARAELLSEANALTAERDALGDELATFRTRVEDLQRELEAAQDAHAAELVTLRAQLDAFVEEQTAAQQAAAADLEDLQARLNHLIEERDALDLELATVRSQLSDATAAGETGAQELTELRTQLEAIAAEREAVILQLATLQTRFDETVQERDALAANLADLNTQVTDKTAAQETLESELAALRTQFGNVTEERDEFITQLDELQAHLDKIAEQRSAFEAELTALRPQMQNLTAERDAFEAEIVPLQAQLDEMTQERDRREAELSTLHSQINDITLEKDTFEAEIATLRARLDELEQERNTFEADLTALQVQFDEFESGREALESEVNTLRTQLKEVRDEAQGAKVALESELGVLREQLAQVTQERNEFEAELASAQTHQEEIAQEHDQERLALQERIATLQEHLATANSDRTTIETELVALRTQLEDTEAEWRSRVQTLEAESETLRQAQAETQAQREALQAERDTLMAQLAEVRLQLEALPLALTAETGATGARTTGARVTGAIALSDADTSSIATESPDREVVQVTGQIADIRRDPLRDINGIGPIYEQKLFNAGIYTFADLAALTPAQVQEIIRPAAWQQIFPALWIEEAARFAQGVDIPADTDHDPLRDINGIGPVYEQKLFDGGIFTFGDLATATPEQLQTLIQPESWQRFDPEAWIAEAQLISGRSPASIPAEVPRNPLYEINGIGPVYEQKLFAAGITTFAALAEASEAQILDIIQPASWQRIFPNLWIEEARERSRQPDQSQPDQTASSKSAETPAVETTPQAEPPAASPSAKSSSSPTSKSTPSRKKPPSKRGKRR